MLNKSKKSMDILKYEYAYVSDDTMYAYMDMERAKEEGNEEEYKENKALWEELSYEMQWYEHEMEMIEKGAKERTDFVPLNEVRDIINDYFEREGISMAIPPISYFEDYGLDIVLTGRTANDKFLYKEGEVKALCGRFGEDDYQRNIAGRNGHCRYLSSSATQEELMASTWSRDDIPEEFGNKPIAIINAMTLKGTYEGSKADKLKKASGWLIYPSKNKIWVFTSKALKKAILNGFWVHQQHSTYFGGGYGYEYKLAIDLDKASWVIPCDIPEEKLKMLNDKS